jgi:phospholipase C
MWLVVQPACGTSGTSSNGASSELDAGADVSLPWDGAIAMSGAGGSDAGSVVPGTDGGAGAIGSDAEVAGDAGRGTARFPIRHIIFLVKENRTFDNYFGKFPKANGSTTGQLSTGQTIALGPLIDRSTPDISHSW